jgi:steroid Delta-isomerase
MTTPSQPAKCLMDNELLHARVDAVVAYFESLTPASVADLAAWYTEQATFKDPFNEVHGLHAIERIFAHMFIALDKPRFVVTERVVQNGQCFLVWDFVFQLKRFDTATVQTIRGASQLRFAADGRIDYHRDYWDAAEELYEKLPLLGTLMRWLKRRANDSTR